jgi:biotin-dependent carboxylase-like uncharacterized protein
VIIHIAELGWSTTTQDAGRPGHAAVGVAPSGALDSRTHALVNRLVGNAEDAPVLETAGRLRLRAEGPCLVAMSAEAGPRAVRPGEEVVVDPARDQLWGYIAVRGGFVLDPVLGSVSQDTLSGLGPPALQVGQQLAIGPDPGTPVVVDHAPPAVSPIPLRVWPGPRVDWFAAGALDRFVATPWRVSSDVSRVGIRLDGDAPVRRISGELPSEGLVTGAIQVPPDGRPTVMLADHPTTGGYPVIAVVEPTSLATVAQCRPGTVMRFSLVRP